MKVRATTSPAPGMVFSRSCLAQKIGLAVQLVDGALDPGDLGSEAAQHGGAGTSREGGFGAIMALLLGPRHDHELVAPRQQGPQLNRLLIRHRTWFGTDGFCEVGDVGGVDRVALGEARPCASVLQLKAGLSGILCGGSVAIEPSSLL
jgi:hypothetical protein